MPRTNMERPGPRRVPAQTLPVAASGLPDPGWLSSGVAGSPGGRAGPRSHLSERQRQPPPVNTTPAVCFLGTGFWKQSGGSSQGHSVTDGDQQMADSPGWGAVAACSVSTKAHPSLTNSLLTWVKAAATWLCR